MIRCVLISSLLVSCLLPVHAVATDRYVTESGSDASNDCANSASPCGTINHAAKEAVSGDTVKVAQGTYHENISLEDSTLNPLTFQGGWNTDFTVRNEDPSMTVVDGGESDRVFDIWSQVSSDFTIQGFKIVNGVAPNWGGGVCFIVTGGGTMYVTLTENIIMNNTSSSQGGGVFVKAQTGGSLILDAQKNIIMANETGAGNGAGVEIIAQNSSVVDATLKNNIIADNAKTTIGFGLNIYTYDGQCTVNLINNTITNNNNNSTAGGVKLVSSQSGASTQLNSTNSIIWGNSGYDIYIHPLDSVSTAEVNASYSDIGTFYIGGLNGGLGVYNNNGNNIDSDPLFQNESINNYHLKRTSPCTGAGVYAKRVWLGSIWALTYYDAPTEDFEGDSRNSDWVPVSPSTDYKYCDIGADEFVASQVAPGDVNGDGTVDLADVIVILKVLTDQSTMVYIEADLDSNGTIGIEDALRLIDQLSL